MAWSSATAGSQGLTDREEMEACSGEKSSWGGEVCMVDAAPTASLDTVVVGVNRGWGRKKRKIVVVWGRGPVRTGSTRFGVTGQFRQCRGAGAGRDGP
jgi:hypothetical protein